MSENTSNSNLTKEILGKTNDHMKNLGQIDPEWMQSFGKFMRLSKKSGAFYQASEESTNHRVDCFRRVCLAGSILSVEHPKASGWSGVRLPPLAPVFPTLGKPSQRGGFFVIFPPL